LVPQYREIAATTPDKKYSIEAEAAMVVRNAIMPLHLLFSKVPCP
jgi:hypothetical protein